MGKGLGGFTAFSLILLLVTGATCAPRTYTDLHTLGRPFGFSSASPYLLGRNEDVAGGQVVGWGNTTGGFHAVLWTPSARNGIDVNPTGFTSSQLWGTNDTQRVGYGSGLATGNVDHALLWSGSAATTPGQDVAVPAHRLLKMSCPMRRASLHCGLWW